MPWRRHRFLSFLGGGNARAEMLNGILKQEYGLGCSFLDKERVLAAIKEAAFS
jgi:hypothetical protein